MSSPTIEQIARDENLWKQHVDPNNEQPGAFGEMTQAEREAVIRELWPDSDEE